MKTNDQSWYEPLKAQFPETGDMTLERFARVEAVLYLLHQTEPLADPGKAFLLFTQYHLIGAEQGTPMEHILQRARLNLGFYRSQKAWQDDWSAYRNPCFRAFRAFSEDECQGKKTISPSEQPYPYPFELRRKEWEQLWNAPPKPMPSPDYAGEGRYRYTRLDPKSRESVTVYVEYPELPQPPEQPEQAWKERRPPICVPVAGLLAVAEEMRRKKPDDYCASILKTNILKKASGSVVRTSKTLTLQGVVNVVGMVGSGKSTLMKVLSYWCNQHRYRVVLVVDTVAEAFHLHKYLSAFGIICSPLVGRGERLKYINQLAQPSESCLDPVFSEYLTPCCMADGLNDQEGEAITFGREPCYTQNKGNKRYLCPFFDFCKGTKMLRDCYQASVVVTTIAGFAAARVGHNQETFLELAIRDFDLVLFDECDRVQKTLDCLFLPETSFDRYISDSAEECRDNMKLGSKRREENPALQRYDELQRQSVIVLSCLIQALRQELDSWQKVIRGDSFSALTLLEDLHIRETKYQISEELYRSLYALFDSDGKRNQQDALWAALQSACSSRDDSLFHMLYEAWMSGTGFSRPADQRDRQIQDNRLKLILKLAFFDHYIRELRDAYEVCHNSSDAQNELFGFLQSRFRQQQYYLPSAGCGNLFGLKKNDEEDLVLYRQYAFGRSLMKDLPYLQLDERGNPAGPHVMLLSGSSWAEGAYEYHVNRPVNYILEADGEKRAFLERTRFYESGFTERVSGAAPEHRMEQLQIIVKNSVGSILQEYQRRAGKLLLVVNSYAQAEEIQQPLTDALRKEGCPAQVCRLVSDAASDSDEAGTIRRGEVGQFADWKEEILIAPAMAIERGHNIVDEQGHSALGAVFFLVRPMAVPDDIQTMGSKLNGYLEAECRRKEGESLFAFNSRFRQMATRKWAQMNSVRAFGLSDLEPKEQRDIVATLFVLILQIFGRLARITDTSRPEPHVWFMDGAFRGREDKPGDYDCLAALERYLEELITREDSQEIAKTLYEPFYKALKGGIHHG